MAKGDNLQRRQKVSVCMKVLNCIKLKTAGKSSAVDEHTTSARGKEITHDLAVFSHIFWVDGLLYFFVYHII